ncbi:hypothetical protein SEA_HITTER_35 [Gordonia phage Hitter]|nr:hypothetical protein SEA_HITTER_35 [Gordonia phage Hitter]QNJ58442.1 hypothetical protein SEA_ARCHIS_37 [Gordonia phage Archis]
MLADHQPSAGAKTHEDRQDVEQHADWTQPTTGRFPAPVVP